MYTCKNFKSKKELTAAFASDKPVMCYQPNDMFGASGNGSVGLEGPHYPHPHKWYASAVIQDFVIVSLGGKTAAQLKAKLDKAAAKTADLDSQYAADPSNGGQF